MLCELYLNNLELGGKNKVAVDPQTGQVKGRDANSAPVKTDCKTNTMCCKREK